MYLLIFLGVSNFVSLVAKCPCLFLYYPIQLYDVFLAWAETAFLLYHFLFLEVLNRYSTQYIKLSLNYLNVLWEKVRECMRVPCYENHTLCYWRGAGVHE